MANVNATTAQVVGRARTVISQTKRKGEALSTELAKKPAVKQARKKVARVRGQAVALAGRVDRLQTRSQDAHGGVNGPGSRPPLLARQPWQLLPASAWRANESADADLYGERVGLRQEGRRTSDPAPPSTAAAPRARAPRHSPAPPTSSSCGSSARGPAASAAACVSRADTARRRGSAGSASISTGTASALSDVAYATSNRTGASADAIRATFARATIASGLMTNSSATVARPDASAPNANESRRPRSTVAASHNSIAPIQISSTIA